jgi:hypothetical protein
MPKKAKLSPVPRPKHRKRPAPPAGPSSADASPPAGPDLSYILESLRPLAVPIGELEFDPTNARLHPERNLEAIKGR